ncbi:hypothetical protein JTE90_019488 [Oedothorax gibbosus]|uniref:C2H2-type domain-containing protein n=1 Tax=Oedothorax gibbosus TaxID=931172 RepID=A0AAV6UJ33_9ARAC|nr:hypothetical protein JTE90_019488 [Oedothorax gibbosus]
MQTQDSLLGTVEIEYKLTCTYCSFTSELFREMDRHERNHNLKTALFANSAKKDAYLKISLGTTLRGMHKRWRVNVLFARMALMEITA